MDTHIIFFIGIQEERRKVERHTRNAIHQLKDYSEFVECFHSGLWANSFMRAVNESFLSSLKTKITQTTIITTTIIIPVFAFGANTIYTILRVHFSVTIKIV